MVRTHPSLTGRSTWTPTAAMPSAFYWPLLVPCAPTGLRRQLTSSLDTRVNTSMPSPSASTSKSVCGPWSSVISQPCRSRPTHTFAHGYRQQKSSCISQSAFALFSFPCSPKFGAIAHSRSTLSFSHVTAKSNCAFNLDAEISHRFGNALWAPVN